MSPPACPSLTRGECPRSVNVTSGRSRLSHAETSRSRLAQLGGGTTHRADHVRRRPYHVHALYIHPGTRHTGLRTGGTTFLDTCKVRFHERSVGASATRSAHARGRREDGAGRWYVSIRAFRTTSGAYAMQQKAAVSSSRPTGGVGYLCGGRVMAGGASCHDTASRLRGLKLPGQYLRTPDEQQTGIWTRTNSRQVSGRGNICRGRSEGAARTLEWGSQNVRTRTGPGYIRSKQSLHLSRSTISRQGEFPRLHQGMSICTSPAHSEAPASISAPTTLLIASRLAPTPPPSPTPRVRLACSRARFPLRLRSFWCS